MIQGQRWAQCRFPGTHTVPHHEVDFVRIVKTPSCAPTDVEKISFNHFNGPCSFFDAWLHVKMQMSANIMQIINHIHFAVC